MNIPNLIEPLKENLKKKIAHWPCHSNRASFLGEECERKLYYHRTAWNQATLHDEDLQAIFEEGRLQEKKLLRDLEEAGVEIYEQQSSLIWEEYNITGHVDATVKMEKDKTPIAVPLEIKSMSPNIWNMIFKRGWGVYEWAEVKSGFEKKPWLRKYFAQIQIYMLCKEVEYGIMLCKNKSNGAIAQLNIGLDWEYAEQLVKKAERLNRYVEKKELPPPILFSNEVCRSCEYNHLCCPDQIALDPYVTVSDDQVAEWCKTDLENEEASKQRNKARKELLAWVKANGNKNHIINNKYNLIYNGRSLKLEEI